MASVPVSKQVVWQQGGDRVGMWASVMCAVHCALLPVVLALLPALGLGAFSLVDIDQAFVVFATVLGVTTMTLGYRRHRAFSAWFLLIAGLVLVWANTFTALHDHSVWHAVMMVIGGLLIASAHFVNLRLTHRRAPRPDTGCFAGGPPPAAGHARSASSVADREAVIGYAAANARDPDTD